MYMCSMLLPICIVACSTIISIVNAAAADAAANAATVDITGVLHIPSKMENKMIDGSNGVVGNDILLSNIFTNSRVILEDGKEYGANVDQRGIFRIPNVDFGTYILQVVNKDIDFEEFTIDVLPDNKVTVYHFDPLHPSHGKPVTSGLPLVITAINEIQYFTERESFNLMHVLKSPMAIMALVMCGLMLCLPRLQQSMMDEDTMKEMKEVADNDDGITGGLMRAMTGGAATTTTTKETTLPRNNNRKDNSRRRGGGGGSSSNGGHR